MLFYLIDIEPLDLKHHCLLILELNQILQKISCEHSHALLHFIEFYQINGIQHDS